MNIFIFHRDFRLEDNLGLIALREETERITLIFVMTNLQSKPQNNEYFSPRAFQAMIYCLKRLNQKKHINILQAKDESSAIKNLIKQGHKINKIYTNKDLSPFAWKRSLQMFALAKKHHFIYREFDDYLLNNYDKIKTEDGKFYQIFTPYFNKVIKQQKKIKITKLCDFNAQKLSENLTIDLNNFKDNDFSLPLTIKEVKQQIKNLPVAYEIERNILSNDQGTSHLSAAIKFGVVSIRQIHLWSWEKFQTFNNSFTRQLLWRDFFYQVTFNAFLQNKWKFGENWVKKMNALPWEKNNYLLEKWKKGQTGFPIVDSAMRELNDFGTMHNRARLIAASFLVKNCLVNWKEGEKYFAQKLIDYDPVVNQCSWQWVAGTGFDAQIFVRIFNPELQQKKFDKHFRYINRYLTIEEQKIPPVIDYQKSVKKALNVYNQYK